jgi:Na+-driven multidrug efflux pump
MNQAYGARNYGALGVVLQQAVVISTLVFALIFALWTQIDKLLLLAGVPYQQPSWAYCTLHCKWHAQSTLC